MHLNSKENLKVIVRLRPLVKKEEEDISAYETFWQGRKKTNNKGKLAQNALNFFTKYHNVRPDEVMKISETCVSVCDQEYKNTDRKMRDYFFSEVFQAGINNMEIFGTLKDEVEGVLEGINCTVLAYGITGSGKTFSVFGHPKTDRGLSHLAFEHLFARKKEIESPNLKIEMRFSFIEIYNQNIRDLLSEDGKKPVVIGQDNHGNISLIDANEVVVKSVEQIVHLISAGTAKRTSAATEFNLISSRSHAVLKMSMDITRNGEKRTSKLFIIDLAGSEKISNESNRRRQEGSNINRSLLTLGNCINALVDNDKKPGSSHVPYRDSKLTRLLKDSLGGSARTIMVACISPHPFSLDQTITTLNYAQRAQGIKRDISKHVKQPEHECTRCQELMTILMTSQKDQDSAFEKINIRQPLLQMANSEVEGIFIQICERLYEDVIENAKQREQIQRLKRQLVEPCEEFDLILKDNEDQRVSLKDILFKLLNQKTKIVVKEQESKTMSARKKIRLSNSSKKSIQVKQVNLFQDKENFNMEFQTEKKVEFSRCDQDLFPEFIDTSFNSPKLFNFDQDRKSIEAKSPVMQGFQSEQKPHKRKRSKFQMVPKPPGYGSGSKVSQTRVLSQQRMSNA